MFGEAVAAFLLAFPALFSILNPPGSAIIFNEVTAGHSHVQRVALARKVALYSTFLILGALILGSHVLRFFGVSLDALRIAGGFVVSIRAFEMLSAPDNATQRKQEQAKPLVEASPHELGSYAFFPLTLPFTAGPGTIAVAISLGAARPDGLEPMSAFYAGATLAVLVMTLCIWAAYSMSDRLSDMLGDTGRAAVSRLAAFLLMGIGVQIALGGIVPVLHSALVS
ncbi:MarC family protein [Acidocella sp.]|uniref:MarC family protein n=1 Tax=Acidocella sp. TaxID=50710 RepID=UPI00260B2C8A|nr:NAAT family transporter [Acidocella sp.]